MIINCVKPSYEPDEDMIARLLPSPEFEKSGLLIIIRGVVCCRAGGMVGLLARGIEHKARGGRTQISTSSKTTEMLEEVIWNQPRSQGSLLPALRSSLSLRRAGRREPWERG